MLAKSQSGATLLENSTPKKNNQYHTTLSATMSHLHLNPGVGGRSKDKN